MSETANRRGSDGPPSLHSIVAAALLVPLIYVLSYAPVYRLQNGRTQNRIDFDFISPPPTIPFYQPVEWLIEETPLQDPLLYWAELCGVRGGIEIDAFLRVQFRQAASMGTDTS